MPSLADVLQSRPTIVGEYINQRERNRASEMQDVQQAATLAQLLGQAQQMKQREAAMAVETQTRELLRASGGDPDKAVQAALSTGNYAAARALAPVAAEARKAKQEKSLQDALSVGSTISGDPARLRQTAQALILSGHPGGAPLLAEAERREKEGQNREMLESLRGQPQAIPAGAPVPGTGMTTQTEIPAQDRAAFEAVASGQAKSAQPQASDVTNVNADLAALMQSDIPSIANRARLMNMQLQRSGSAVSGADWERRITALQAENTRIQEAKSAAQQRVSDRPEEQLVAVIKDGKPVMLPRSQAVGLPPASAMTVGSVVPTDHQQLHGEEYLATLPSDIANTVKAIAEYRMPPSAVGIRGRERVELMLRVAQYAPEFDITNYTARNALRREFTSGTAARNVTAINTAIGHMGTMSALAEAMKNNDVRALNAAINAVRDQFGNPNINNYSIAMGAVANELMRVFRQVGAHQQEVADWEKRFRPSGSPEQLQKAIAVGGELLQSRIDALDDQWKRGMGTKVGFPDLVSPKSKEALELIKGRMGGSNAVREFRTEAEAAAANLPRGARVKIGGVLGTWQ